LGLWIVWIALADQDEIASARIACRPGERQPIPFLFIIFLVEQNGRPALTTRWHQRY